MGSYGGTNNAMNTESKKPLFHSEEGQALQAAKLAAHFEHDLKVRESLKQWRVERNAIIAKRKAVK